MTGWTVALLAVALVSVWGQMATPQPDKDGVYSLGVDVKPPKLVNAVAAVYPDDLGLLSQKHVCTLRVVVGADGVPAKIEIAKWQTSPYDDAAIAAVKQSRFEPGTFKGSPAPVRVFIYVPFLGKGEAAVPVIDDGLKRDLSNPVPLNTVEAQMSDEARRENLQGIVLVQVLVTDRGLPTNAVVIRPFGHGLDEQALKAVKKYRFKPAMFHGVPVPTIITVEVNFQPY